MINQEYLRLLKENNLSTNPLEQSQGILFGFLITYMYTYPELENLLFNSGLFPYEKFQEYQIQLCRTNSSGNLELIVPLTGFDNKSEFSNFIEILGNYHIDGMGHQNNRTNFLIFSSDISDIEAFSKTKEELGEEFNIDRLAIVTANYYESAEYPSKLKNLLGTKNIISLYKSYTK